MRFVSRAEWGAVAARGSTPLQPQRVRMFVLHHTTGSYRGPSTVRAIQKFHQGPQRGWADIGYNFLVGPDGVVYEGRGWAFQGAHARGHNAESVGVAFIGDGSRRPPAAAEAAIVWLFGEAERRFGSLRRVGHRDVGSTACPGDALYRWWVSVGALPAAPSQRPPDALREPEAAGGGAGASVGEVSSQGVSGLRGGVPDLREGWRRHMGRMGWLRRR